VAGVGAALLLPSVADAATVYTGKSANGRAHVRLTLFDNSAKARITLSPRAARRAAEHAVRLHCGSGSYGHHALVRVQWPQVKRSVRVGLTRTLTSVDRCRVTRNRRGVARMRMRLRRSGS
jgi:hypothetical protein